MSTSRNGEGRADLVDGHFERAPFGAVLARRGPHGAGLEPGNWHHDWDPLTGYTGAVAAVACARPVAVTTGALLGNPYSYGRSPPRS